MTITQNTKTTADLTSPPAHLTSDDLDGAWDAWLAAAVNADHDMLNCARAWEAREDTVLAESYPEQDVPWEDCLDVEWAEALGII